MSRFFSRMLLPFLTAILFAIVVAGFGEHPTLPGALHAAWSLIHDTLSGHNLLPAYYGTTVSGIWFTLRLIGFAIFGGCTIGITAFALLAALSNSIFRAILATIVDFLELIPETMYIICLALAVVLLIEMYQVSLPAFPVLDPTWKDTLIPAAALSVPGGLYILRVLAIALHDEEQADYVRTAWSKGGGRLRILLRHIIPNVLSQSMHAIPVLTATVTSSTLFTEFFFGYQGMMFHLTDFADWSVNSPPLAKPTGIPPYNLGSVALVLAILVGVWAIAHAVTELITRAAFPVERDRQPGVSLHRVQKAPIVVGGLILLLMLVAGCFPTLVTAHSPTVAYPQAYMLLPSHAFPFGTDDLHRDVFARILYGTPRTLAVMAVITLAITMGSLTLGALGAALDSQWFSNVLRILGLALSPLPVLVILRIVLMHRDLASHDQLLVYIAWFATLGMGRGAYNFQGAISGWMSFGFMEGVDSIGVSRVRALFTHLRPWLWRFTAEFTFAETIRVLAIMIELAAFRVYPTEVIGPDPYEFSGKPPYFIQDAHLTWLSLMGPITSNYAYIDFPSVLFGPVAAFLAVTLASGLIIRGIRGTTRPKLRASRRRKIRAQFSAIPPVGSRYD